MLRAKAIAKWGAIGLGGLLLLAAIGLAVGVGWLRSEAGRDWLAGRIEAAVSTPGELELTIGRLDGDPLAQLGARDIVLRDAEGTWLTVDALDLTWRPWALLDRTLAVESLVLSDVALSRLPASPAQAAEDGAEDDGGLPELPVKVRVGRLAVDEIALGAPVLGQAARFSLAGVAASREDGGFGAGLDLERLDGPEARLRAELDYDPAGDILTAEIDATEAPGGLLATLLEQPDLPRTELKLSGSGPLSAWQGDFTLSLGELARAEAAIGLRRDATGDLGFSLDGQASLSPPADSATWALVAGDTTVNLEGSWQDDRRLHLTELTLANGQLRLTAEGDLEPQSGSLDMTLNAAAEDGAALAGLLGLERLGKLSSEIAVTGNLAAPAVSLTLRAEDLAGPDIEAAALQADGRVATADLSGPAPVLDLDITGRIDSPRLPGQDAVNQVLGDALPFTLHGGLNLDTLVLDIAALEAGTAIVSLSGSGPFNLGDGTADLKAALAVNDLTALQPLTEIRLGGQARLAGPVTLADYGGTIQADLTGRWDEPASDIGLVNALAGQGFDIATRLAIADGALRLESVTARSDIAELDAALTVAGGELRDGRYRLALSDAAVLAEQLGVALAGPAEVQGTLAGPFDALAFGGDAQATGLTLAEQELTDLSARYELRLSGADVDGPVSVALTSPYGRAEGRADLRLRENAVTLAALHAQLPETTVDGEVVVPLDGGDPRADLRGEFADLGTWLALADLEGAGQGRLHVRWNQPGAAAPLLASGEFSALVLRPEPGAEPLTIDRLALSLQAQDPGLAEPATIAAEAEALNWQRLELARLQVDGNGTPKALDLTLAAQGRWIEPLQLQAAGRVAQEGDRLTVALNEANGTAFGQPLTLRQAATLTLAPGMTRLEGLDLASGETRLTADARLDGEGIAATMRLDALPMTTVDAFWQGGLEGTVSAQLDLQGPTSDPSGSARVDATGLRPRGAENLPALDLATEATWRNGRVALQGELGGGEVTAARFNGDVPLRLTADGAGLEVPPEGALSGALDWRGGIETALLFVPLPQHRLGGMAEVDLTVGGTVAAPTLDGSLALSQGSYESLEHGTLLRELTLRAQLADDQIRLTELSAKDGAGGGLTGGGEISIDPARDFPFDVTLRFNKFHALRREGVTAVAGGDLRLSGDADAPKVEGRFTTETVEISLATQLPSNVVELDVIEVKGGVVQERSPEAETDLPVVAALDIVVEMPNRVFVRGRGLDSEWAGRITVQGSSAAPVIGGAVNLVRGQMSVVGKAFNLKEGKVTLPQGAEAEAQLDVTAVHRGESIEVTARMTGPVTQPSLELTSSPEVPRDEIVSRVLFNKSAAQLSPAEAAQLALALRDLAGQGGGTDVLGFARRALGVDVLRVETGGEGQPAVEAGKYLTDEVYLGVKQGATSQSSGAEVEVELTPNITIESEVTGSGANKSGLRFQLDY